MIFTRASFRRPLPLECLVGMLDHTTRLAFPSSADEVELIGSDGVVNGSVFDSIYFCRGCRVALSACFGQAPFSPEKDKEKHNMLCT